MNEINRINIKKLKGKYLKNMGITQSQKLTKETAEELFIKVIEDFKKGIISSDVLSSFGFNIFHEVAKKYPDSDLFRASLSASELTFTLRTKTVFKNISGLLEDIDNYYNKEQKS
jgi:hypothetical protein